jgi:hypothetical protein
MMSKLTHMDQNFNKTKSISIDFVNSLKEKFNTNFIFFALLNNIKWHFKR